MGGVVAIQAAIAGAGPDGVVSGDLAGLAQALGVAGLVVSIVAIALGGAGLRGRRGDHGALALALGVLGVVAAVVGFFAWVAVLPH